MASRTNRPPPPREERGGRQEYTVTFTVSCKIKARGILSAGALVASVGETLEAVENSDTLDGFTVENYNMAPSGQQSAGGR